MLRRLAAFAAGLMLAFPAAAQFYSLGSERAGTKWRHITTADFDVIYPVGLDSLAQVYAKTLEAVKLPVGKTAGLYPNQLYRKPMPVVMHPWSVYSNGMVAWTPRRMEVYTTPPSDAPLAQPWEEHLLSHESRHVAQMQYVHDRHFRPAEWLVGELTAGALAALYGGPSFFEGDAVAAETELGDAGRGRNAEFLEYFRAAFREGDTRNFWRWRYGSLLHHTPDYYKVGYITNAGMRSVYGAPDFTARYYANLLGGKWPLPFFVMPRTVKQVSGKRFNDAFAEITDTLVQRWSRYEAARAPFMPSVPLTRSGRHFMEYSGTCYMDGQLYTIRNGATRSAQLVRIDSTGRVHALSAFSGNATPLRADGVFKRMYWGESTPHVRRDLESFSDIWYCGPDGRHRRLTRGQRWFNPCPSSDGLLVSVSEYPVQGGSALVLADAFDGRPAARYKAPDGMQIVESAWVGEDIYVSAITHSGQGIYKLVSGSFEPILDCGPVTIKNLLGRGDLLYFTADLNGVDELYSLDCKSGKVFRVTSSPQGGSSYCFAPEGRGLVFSELSASGRNLAFTPAVSLPEPVEVDFKHRHRYEFAEEIGRTQVPPISDTLLQSASYNRLGHLFRFHSWAPLYVNYDAIEDMSFSTLTSTAGLGATAFFQNHLGTMTGVLAYGVIPEEEKWTHRGQMRFTYTGFFPVIEADLTVGSAAPLRYFINVDYHNFARRVTLSREDMAAGPSLDASVKVYAPLKFSSGGWQRGVVPQLRWALSNSLITHGSFAPMNRLSASVRAYAVQSTPSSRIYPALGGGLETGWSGRPWAQNILSSNLYVYGYCYLPGLLDTHGIRIGAMTQTPVSDGIFSERYAAVMPRGMAGYTNLAAQLSSSRFQGCLNVDYAFPFAPVDCSWLSPVAYVRNFECTLHGDVSHFRDGAWNRTIGSVGLDLCAVLGNLLWIPEDTRIGVSYYYNLGVPEAESPHFVDAVFSVSF